MNRATFMMQLRRGLAGLPQNEIDDICADYESHFADGAGRGRSEDEVAAALGDPVRLARELRAEVGFKRWEQNRNASNFLGVVLALLGLATIDIVFLFPILCALAGIFFGFAVAFLALAVAGIFLLFNMLPVFHPALSNIALQAVVATGLLGAGIGGGALLILILEWSARMLVRYARLHYRLLTSANEAV
jgi:uncharacterized membrane protein